MTLFSATISSSTILIIFRLLLGLTEAGLAPALMLYIFNTYNNYSFIFIYYDILLNIRLWFSEKHRARSMSILMMAVPASNFLSGLLSAFIITHTHGTFGFSGWQWLYPSFFILFSSSLLSFFFFLFLLY